MPRTIYESSKYKLTKSLFGNLSIVYHCPKCACSLESAVDDIETEALCPSCGEYYTVPGTSFMKDYRKEKKLEQYQKDKDMYSGTNYYEEPKVNYQFKTILGFGLLFICAVAIDIFMKDIENSNLSTNTTKEIPPIDIVNSQPINHMPINKSIQEKVSLTEPSKFQIDQMAYQKKMTERTALIEELASTTSEDLDTTIRSTFISPAHNVSFDRQRGGFETCSICFSKKDGSFSDLSIQMHLKRVPSKQKLYYQEIYNLLTKASAQSPQDDTVFTKYATELLKEWMDDFLAKTIGNIRF